MENLFNKFELLCLVIIFLILMTLPYRILQLTLPYRIFKLLDEVFVISRIIKVEALEIYIVSALACAENVTFYD